MTRQIPVFTVTAVTLPEAWERAVVRTWNEGLAIATEYDKPGDALSRDCTMIMVIEEPFAEPRIHRAFPGSLEDLEVYRQEVVDGIHDCWIKPEEGKWTYTYHERLFSFPAQGKRVDQVAYIVDKLSSVPHSRRAQAITWNPATDPETDDPPCLQRLWFRLVQDASGYSLQMNSHWRSRDAYKASFMNIFALTDLQRSVAERIAHATGRPVSVGRYVDISDSFHIYGSYAEEFASFLSLIAKRKFEERTWHSRFAEPSFEEAKIRLKAESEKAQSGRL